MGRLDQTAADRVAVEPDRWLLEDIAVEAGHSSLIIVVALGPAPLLLEVWVHVLGVHGVNSVSEAYAAV